MKRLRIQTNTATELPFLSFNGICWGIITFCFLSTSFTTGSKTTYSKNLTVGEAICPTLTPSSAIIATSGTWIDMGIAINAGDSYEFQPLSSTLGTTQVSGGPFTGQTLILTNFGSLTDFDGNLYNAIGVYQGAPIPPLDIPSANLLSTDYTNELKYLGLIDVNGNGTFDAGTDVLIDPLFSVDSNVIHTAGLSGDLYAIYTDAGPGDNAGELTFNVIHCMEEDTDTDVIENQIDLDDDNDGIPDMVEAAGCYPSGNYVRDTLFLDNFGAGTTVSSSDYAQLCYENGTNPCALSGSNLSSGEYTIADTPLKFNSNADWTGLGDHTGDTNGRMMVIDAPSTLDTFYFRPISNYIKNQDLQGAFWARNTIQPTHNLTLPDITIRLVDNLGNVLNNTTTGTIAEDETWHEFTFSANPGLADTIFLMLINNSTGTTGNDLALDDISFTQFVCDTDNDGVANHLDLDSDNDGLFDLIEAGHNEADTDVDGVIDGAASAFGINGLFDALETANDGVIIYTIADSEPTPDGIYDAYELDSDGDGCFDTEEEAIADGDNDGLAGTGIPAVDPITGLVNSITYATPVNTIWQNEVIGPCLSEICNDGIDNNINGLVDCNDCSDCASDVSCIVNDNDNDGISDLCDLDDDNDGIPDLIECNPPANDIDGFFTPDSFYITGNGGNAPVILDSIAITGSIFTDFISPDNYDFSMTTAPSIAHDFVIVENGSTIVNYISSSNWPVDALPAFQSRNMNYYQQISYEWLSGVDYFQVGYTSPISVSQGLFVLFSERSGNNSVILEALDLNQNPLGAQITLNVGDYTITEVNVNPHNQSLALATLPLDDLADLGDLIYYIRVYDNDSGGDVADGKVFIFGEATNTCVDTDSDGLEDYLDLDSDNDGIYDLIEAGHSAADVNIDGVIDGIAADFGSNGLFDAIETSADSDLIDYSISDSESTPDSIYDPYELDSDGDGCFDTEEEAITDGDNDGLVGTGVPTVDPATGLVNGLTYASPPNNHWQNPLTGPCLVEVCNNGIDDDGDGLIDCNDCSDCASHVSCGDNDNDGIGDFCDLDNDNDGIPDSEECSSTFVIDDAHTVSTYDTVQLSTTTSGVQHDILLQNGITFNTTVGPNLNSFQGGTPAPWSGSQTFLWLEINTDQNVDNHGTYTINFPSDVINPTIHFASFSSSVYSPDWSLVMVNQTPAVTMNMIFTDNELLISGDTIRAEPTPSTNGTGIIEFLGIVRQLQFQIGHYSPANQDGRVRFGINVGFTLCDDSDNDGLINIFDLDSDNDGIFDLHEAGHAATDTNDDGIIDGAASLFGTNGLFDALETTVDSDTINYSLADSEAAPNGILDAYEIDADGDGCFDTEEEAIADGDNDGLAGTGAPTVNLVTGLVDGITYASPPNNNWQNELVGPCLPEICNDGIDNDTDGLTDYVDDDCCSAQAPTLQKK